MTKDMVVQHYVFFFNLTVRTYYAAVTIAGSDRHRRFDDAVEQLREDMRVLYMYVAKDNDLHWPQVRITATPIEPYWDNEEFVQVGTGADLFPLVQVYLDMVRG